MPQTFGRYRLLAPLGHDTEAEVFRGVLPGLDGFEKPVVIRRLLDPERHGSAAIARFLDRAHAAAVVQHPNAVPVFEVGNGPNGEPFVVEGWVPGPSLGALLRKVRQAGQRLPTWFALHVASEVLAVLVYGAGKGVTHGGVDADRIRLSYDGEVRLTGFGQRVAAQDHVAIRDVLCEAVGLAPDTPDLPESIRPWIGGREQGDLTTCQQWVQRARAELKPRVTLHDVTSTLAAIEADAHDWRDEIPATATSEPDMGGHLRAALLNPSRIAPGASPLSGPTTDSASTPKGLASLVMPDGTPSTPVPPAAELSPLTPTAREPASSSMPRSWTEFADIEPTDPCRPPIETTPTLEIHPGRRADVQIWLEVPPAVVGPRQLEEGLRLICELGMAREDLSLSVDGYRFVALHRVARQLQDTLPVVGPLDPTAPVQGVLAEKTVLQVIGERARARATGRLTFQRHEPDFPERICLDLVDGHLVDASASSAPLAAWIQLISDPNLPDGLALRALAVVISEDTPVSDVGSPLLLAALAQARADCVDAQLETVLAWPWARFAFVPQPGPPVAERVTEVALLPRLLQWVIEEESTSALRARLIPVLDRPMTRADDYDVVLSRLRLSPELLEFAAALGHNDALRDALNQIESTKREPQALALTHVLTQLGALTPA